MALTKSQERAKEQHSKYWQDREDEQLQHYMKEEAEYDKEIEQIYRNMLDNCQKEIDAFYGKYAKKEGITIAEAKKRVSEADIKAYERKAKKYVKDAERDRKANGGQTNYDGYYFSEKANEEMRLYNLTMKVNRLELLKANIGLELVKGHNELEGFMGRILQGRAIKELERQAGILGETVKDVVKNAHSIVNASFHNATFSDRIWQYQDMMKADLSKLLQSGMIQGKNARVLAKELRKYFIGEPRLKNGRNGAMYNTERLMRTEMARVQTEAQKQSYLKNGVTKYMFIVNRGCCPICEELRDKKFDVVDMMPGKNASPLHPHCRCSTAPAADRDEYEAKVEYLLNGGTLKGWEKQKAKKMRKLSKSSSKVLEKSAKGSKIKMKLQIFAEKDIQNQPSNSLKRAIRKYESKIAEHEEKIAHPESLIPDWETKDVREQNGLKKHWQKEIRNFKQSIDDRIEELKKRGDYDE